jgi:hypothetical protein
MRLAHVVVLTVLLAVSAATPALAQIGLVGGVNLAGVSASAAGADVSTDDRTAWHFGAFASRGGLLGLHLGVLYSQKGFGVGGAAVDLDYLEVPLMLRVKFLMLRGYGGVNLAFEINCAARNDPALNGVAFSCGDTESFDFGWKIGAGGQLLFFSLDLAYAVSTMDIWKVEDGSIKNRVFQISVGIGL